MEAPTMAQKNGRTPPPETLYDFTFPDTGRTVQIRKVSSLLRQETRRQVVQAPGFEEPQPPTSKVDYGEGNVTILNPQHPIYQDLRRDWNARVNEETGTRLRHIAIRRGVVCEVDMEAVASVRQDMTAEGVSLKEFDDHYVYVAFVCVGSDDDWTDLLKAIFERSAPQEAAVQAHIAAFQPDVPAEAAV
jgi:hypothetical protein